MGWIIIFNLQRILILVGILGSSGKSLPSSVSLLYPVNPMEKEVLMNSVNFFIKLMLTNSK